MAEEKKQETETPEVTPPVTEQTAEVETPEPAEKPEETPEVEAEEEVEAETPEPEVDKQVPLSELQKERERRRQAEQALFNANTPQTPVEPSLEPEAESAVRPVARQEAISAYREIRAQEFVRRHPELANDPMLDGTVQKVIRDKGNQGFYIDPEDALVEAKALCDESFKTREQKTKDDSFKEGVKTQKVKQKAGAVGTSGPRQEVDESKMTSEEYAKYHSIPRVS